MRVLSLFDGMSCGQLALNKVGIKYDEYLASEIDKWAISVTMENFPKTSQLGDITNLDGKLLGKIDLVIGGSPCQSFSRAGDGSGFDGKSALFWEYIRVLRETSPKYFLLENVVMKKEWEEVITNELGVDPIKINSGLLSAQNRDRLYWTNIPNVTQPEDLGLTLSDVIENNVPRKYHLSDKGKAYMSGLRNGKQRWDYNPNKLDGKAGCLTAGMWRGVPYGIIEELSRRLTPKECERLQTVPEGYTSSVSDTQRYKMLGNGWTVDVVAHILKHLKEWEEKEKLSL